ncbi:MAG: SDR family oxidoreductase [Bacteroidota bacterium]
MNVKDKAIIVTGAGKGIGFAICRKLAQSGARIILNDIDPEVAELGASRVREFGPCVAISGDSGDPSIVAQLVEGAVREFGRLDTAIANCGITVFGDFFTYPKSELDRVLQVNIGGTFYLAQAAANQFRKQQSPGTLLFTSSVVGHQAHKNLAAYGMSKAAIENLAKHLVLELAPYRINVNAIAPGATLTERTIIEDKDYEKVWSRITPTGRPASVEDIANAALFFVSEEARHINGQTLIIDGGWTSVSPSPF